MRCDDVVRAMVFGIVLNKLTMLGYADPTPLTPSGRKSRADVPHPLDEPIDEVHQAICNYCNIDCVPEELKYVWANMVVDYWRWSTSVAGSGSGTPGKPNLSTVAITVASLKEGDTTIGFSADTASQSAQSGNAHSMAAVLDQVVMNYLDQLNRFRRVVW